MIMNRSHPMRTVTAVALVLCLATPARGQMPDTPAGRQLSGWLSAFNAGTEAALKQFADRNVAPGADGLLQVSPRVMEFRQRTGGFDFRRTDSSTRTRLAALVQERESDQIARVVIEVEPALPNRITSLSLDAVARPADLAVARLSEPALVSALRTKLATESAAGRFSGAVIVAHNGRALFEGAYGLADREKHLANTLDTRFRIGSMNKMFTAVAVLQLAQAGKLQLDAPLASYLPSYPNKSLASKVTIHHLLTHTGGTGDIFGPQFQSRRKSLRTIGDYLTLYGARDVAFEPGSRFEYSNYGFILLGAVIEKVSGMSYYDYVEARVFAPAGMTSTASLPEDTMVAARSVGYTRDDPNDPLTSNAATLPYRGTSAGGGYSTVRDLVRFAEALRARKLLDSAHTALLTTGKVDARGDRYAYGFFDRRVGGVRFVGHGGGAPGMNGDLQIDPQTGYVIAVLANLDPPAAQRISTFIMNRLPAGGGQTTSR
jgi:D-alanyl-D-alanine carboxypeptidase